MSPVRHGTILRYFEVAAFSEPRHVDHGPARPAAGMRDERPGDPIGQLDLLWPWDSWADDRPEPA